MAPVTLDNSLGAVRLEALRHVGREAVPALRLWSAQGPSSILRRNNSSNGLKYLQGFCVWSERVYGAPSLGAAMRSSIARSAQLWKLSARIRPTNMDALIADWETVMMLALKGAKPGARLPIWLPGALEVLPQNVPATQLALRAPLSLRAGESVATRLFVPLDARVLHLELKGAGGANILSVQSWKSRPAATGAQTNVQGNAQSSAVEVDLEGQTGWRRFVWTARAPLTIGAAWLGK